MDYPLVYYPLVYPTIFNIFHSEKRGLIIASSPFPPSLHQNLRHWKAHAHLVESLGQLGVALGIQRWWRSRHPSKANMKKYGKIWKKYGKIWENIEKYGKIWKNHRWHDLSPSPSCNLGLPWALACATIFSAMLSMPRWGSGGASRYKGRSNIRKKTIWNPPTPLAAGGARQRRNYQQQGPRSHYSPTVSLCSLSIWREGSRPKGITSSKGKKQENKKEEARSNYRQQAAKKQETRSQEATRGWKTGPRASFVVDSDSTVRQAAGRQLRELVFL